MAPVVSRRKEVQESEKKIIGIDAGMTALITLSNGQQFRAGLARLVTEAPKEAVIDEFTSVVDRQIAKIGALSFGKNWRRNKGKKVVLLSCHYDIIEWLQPDWVYDVNTKVLKKKATLGNAQKSDLKFGRSAVLIGSCLKSITI